MAKGDAVKEDRTPTKRTVLEKVRVIVIPASADPAVVENACKTVRGKVEQAWMERGEFEGSKPSAIEQYAGKPGTSDAKVGEFKAPPSKGWQGAAVYEAPPKPLVNRRMVP